MFNALFPGRPGYTGPTSGDFGLLHHDVLAESSHDVIERVTYVRREKPANEVAIRLHNMIFLGGCPAAAERAALYAEILAYIKTHIPDCAWNGKELAFGGRGETP